MQFIDEVEIEVKAGKGGRGASTFRREKFVPFGGPDGGDGGKGGSVILVANRNIHTLLDFQFKPKWEAKSGEPGAGSLKAGKDADNLIIKVPVGTQIFLQPDNILVVDMDVDGKEHILAKGGRGGKGNDFFKSATNQAPTHSQPGEQGEEGKYTLSLKLVADVGLIGFPNAGKSTLISRISAAKPKIADYPFTTLTPNLGVVKAKGGNFVVADIPGLIPGAHQGRGLGIQFLKHVERTRLLLHLIDPNQLDNDGNPTDPIESYKLINFELESFSKELATRPQMVVLTKADTIHDRSIITSLERKFKALGSDFMAISSISGEGLDHLINTIFTRLQAIDLPQKNALP